MANSHKTQLEILDEDALLTCCVCGELLEDPQQLECLHNCCRRCMSHIMSPEDKRLVGCPECCYVSDTGRMTDRSFIQTLVRRRKAFVNSMACVSCEDQSDVTSLCKQCREFLGNGCSQVTFSSDLHTIQLNDVKALQGEIAGQSGKWHTVLSARDETSPCEAGRFSCDSVPSNNAELFHTQPYVGKTAVSNGIGTIMASVAGLEAAYFRTSEAFSKRREIRQELQAARVQQRKALQKRKLKLLDAIDSVYSVAEKKLDDIFDELEAKADTLTSKTQRLERAASYAASYCRIAVSSDDFSYATRSNQQLVKCIERLTKEVEAVRMPNEVRTMVSVVHLMPESLNDTLATCIGIPTMATDKLEPDNGDEESAAERTSAQHPSRHSVFSQRSQSFELAVDCYDIAIAYDGSLLLAARERGLLECSPRGGELVTSYLPPLRPYSGKIDWVTAVDNTCDDRVAAGIFWQRTVVVLAHGSSGWCEVQCITDVLLTGQLSHMSLYLDVVAVTGPTSDGCRSALSIGSLSSGRVLHHQRRDYIVRCVTVTSASLITASRSLMEQSDSSSRLANVVDAYNYRGDVHLWRYLLGERETAMDVTLNFINRTLYIAVKNCSISVQRRIIAVRVEDGCEVETSTGGGVVVDEQMLNGLKIHRIAWAKTEKGPLLAALSYYTATVALYKAAVDGSPITSTGRRRLEDALQSLKLQKSQPGKILKTFLKHPKFERTNLENQLPKHDKASDV